MNGTYYESNQIGPGNALCTEKGFTCNTGIITDPQLVNISDPDGADNTMFSSDDGILPQNNDYIRSADDGFDMGYRPLAALADTVPPADVTNFTATAGDSRITLIWTNPSDSDFVGTMIRYRTDGTYPTNRSDGTLVCDKSAIPGSNDNFIHTELNNGTTYFYSAFI